MFNILSQLLINSVWYKSPVVIILLWKAKKQKEKNMYAEINITVPTFLKLYVYWNGTKI